MYHEILIGIFELSFVFIYFGENFIACRLLLCVVTIFLSLLFMRLMARKHNIEEEEEDHEEEKERGNNKQHRFNNKTHHSSHHCFVTTK